MLPDIMNDLSRLKEKYSFEGFIILGIFGSFARDEIRENSDIDILYEIDASFINRYGGFGGFSRLAVIKEELQEYFRRDVDLVDRSGLDKVAEKYVLDEVVYV